MLKRFSYLFLFLILLSCGKSEETIVEEDLGIYAEHSYGEPISLNHSKVLCDRQKKEMPEVDLFISGEYSSFIAPKIKSRYMIKSIFIGGEYRQTLKGRRVKGKKLRPSLLFKMCNPERAYGKETYQDAAFSVGVVLNSFEALFEDILKEIQLPKVKINILPHVYQKNKNSLVKGYLTNNAYYHHQRDEITFLPQGRNLKTDRIPFNGVPLWKVPMVSLHEYGHHIFEYAFFHKNKHVKRNGEMRSSLCVDTSSPVHFHVSKVAGKTRKIDHRTLSFKVLNEAVADLVAYYGLQKKMSLKGIGCMERSRNVESPVFYNYTEKVLTTEALDSFLKPEKQKALPCNLAPNFQDEHIVGAIFAHGFAKIMKKMKFSNNTSLRFLIKWLTSLKEISPKSYSVRDYLSFVPKHFFISLQKEKNVSKEICEEFFGHFPASKFECL